ncbi:hypothetical protein NDQ86_11490 [Salinispora arenicola]|nr:hypothetical protein [Salinispora arenicola]
MGRTLAFVLSGGNVNDCTRFTQVLADIRVERSGRGRPRVRPDHVIADKTSHAIWCQAAVGSCCGWGGVKAVVSW